MNQELKNSERESLKQIYRTLPFKKRRMHFADWIYKNKIGVSALVLVTLSLFFAFVSVRFEITGVDMTNGFFIEMPPEPEVEKPIEEKKDILEEQIEREMLENVRNVAANRDAELDGGLKDDRGTKASDLYKEAEALQERLNAAKDSYNKGLEEVDAINNNSRQSEQKKGEQEEVRKHSNVKGRVTVEYKLGGRNATYLPVPAYTCEKGGQVIVNITVNHNGDVIGAEVNSSSSRDVCLNETALRFAKDTRFEIGSSWPERHRGTITYLFLEQ